ncbi:MAG: TraX family protein [bacterium]|nr:TraX family protein [bacterium]
MKRKRMSRQEMLQKWGINGSVLWGLTMIFLLLDHFGAAFMELGVLGGATEAGIDIYSPYMVPDLVLRLFGSIGFPLAAYLFVDGFRRTENIKEYAWKILAVAVVAEIPFDLAFYRNPVYFWHQNLFFTFLLGIPVLMGLKRYGSNIWMKIVVLLVGCGASFVVRGDHGVEGMVLICALYLLWDRRLLQMVFCAVILLQNPFGTLSILAFLPIWLYDGTNYEKLQNVFYIFYPVHIFLLYLLRIIIYKT